MKTTVNKNLFILTELLENKIYSEILQLIDTYRYTDLRLENEKRLLMYDFEDNDVEAQQLIDTIEIQQFYICKNINILEKALEIKELESFIPFTTIGLN